MSRQNKGKGRKTNHPDMKQGQDSNQRQTPASSGQGGVAGWWRDRGGDNGDCGFVSGKIRADASSDLPASQPDAQPIAYVADVGSRCAPDYDLRPLDGGR